MRIGKSTELKQTDEVPYFETCEKISYPLKYIIFIYLFNCLLIYLGRFSKLIKQGQFYAMLCCSLELQDKEWEKNGKDSKSFRKFHRFLAFESLPLPLTLH